jgi:hypothetical protein
LAKEYLCPSPPPTPEEKILQLQNENQNLKDYLAQTNSDFASFMDYFFEAFPELA